MSAETENLSVAAALAPVPAAGGERVVTDAAGDTFTQAPDGWLAETLAAAPTPRAAPERAVDGLVDGVERLTAVYSSAVMSYWSDSTLEHQDKDRAHQAGLRGIAAAFRNTHRSVAISTDDPGHHCPRCGLDDAGIRESLALLNREADRSPDASAPSAVPERAAGGGEMPGAEELAEALWETTRDRHGASWSDMLAHTGHAGEVAAGVIAPYRTQASAILARLAQPRPAAAGEGDAAPGLVDAGAVREFLAADAEFDRLGTEPDDDDPEQAEAFKAFQIKQSKARSRLYRARAALDVALDRAGEGSAPMSTLTKHDVISGLTRVHNTLNDPDTDNLTKLRICEQVRALVALLPSTSTEPSP